MKKLISKLGFSLLGLAMVLSVIGADEHSHWEYDPDNPNAWNEKFPACAGKSQSPIDINSYMAMYNPNLAPIDFKNYDVAYLFNFTNNGHTIVSNQFKDVITGLIPYITGSDFGSDKYKLLQFHFHWGSNTQSGSEHLLDGKAYAGELHLVHQSESGNLAVVGFFLSVTDLSNIQLDYLLKTVTSNADTNSVSTMYLNLASILPNLNQANANGYFRYMGSLTTPPCSEGIIWTVYRQPIQISAKQMKAFYKNSVKLNYRPVQPMNGRNLYLSTQL